MGWSLTAGVFDHSTIRSLGEILDVKGGYRGVFFWFVWPEVEGGLKQKEVGDA